MNFQLQGLLRNTAYTHSYKTVIKSQVLTLKLDDWEYLLQHFPNSRDTIHKHMGKLGDNDKNWPGGPPTATQPTPKYEPLEAQDAVPGPSNFSRLLKTDEEEPEIKSHLDTPSVSRRQSNEEQRGEDQIAGERKRGIIQRITSTAKKLMGRVSDSDLVSSDGKDELFFEEDVEATEALLAQFEKAMRKEMEEKRLRNRRKFFYAQNQEKEKDMFTLGLKGSIEKSASDIFALRSLQIRDDPEEAQDLGNIDELNPERELSEIDLSVNLQIEDETKKSAKFVPFTPLHELYSPSKILNAQVVQETEDNQEIEVSPSEYELVRDPSSIDVTVFQPSQDVTETSIPPRLLDNIASGTVLSEVALKTIKIDSDSNISQSEMGLVDDSNLPMQLVTDKKVEASKARAGSTTPLVDPETSPLRRTESKNTISLKTEFQASLDSAAKPLSTASEPSEIGPSKYDDILFIKMQPVGGK